MTLRDRTVGIFQTSAPPVDHCCWCHARPLYFEFRPTGPDGRRHKWGYCQKHWSLCHEREVRIDLLGITRSAFFEEGLPA